MPTQTAHLLTSTQVGALLGKSARTVQRLAETGDLPAAYKLPGSRGAYLFDPAVIATYRETPTST